MQNHLFISRELAFLNQRIKYYPTIDGGWRVAEICTFSDKIFNPGHFETAAFRDGGGYHSDIEKNERSQKANDCSSQSIRRAQKRAFDLIACNPDCNLFVTLTLDKSRISRDEWSEIVSRLNVWLDNRVRRHGLKYVLIPEYHADGEAIHFHGVMNESSLRLVNSGVKHSGKVVYNIADWKYGFTTAKRIGKTDEDHIKVTKYIFKYMTKASAKIGGRYFLHGGNLAAPRYEYRNADFSSVEGFEVAITDFLRCKIQTLL